MNAKIYIVGCLLYTSHSHTDNSPNEFLYRFMWNIWTDLRQKDKWKVKPESRMKTSQHNAQWSKPFALITTLMQSQTNLRKISWKNIGIYNDFIAKTVICFRKKYTEIIQQWIECINSSLNKINSCEITPKLSRKTRITSIQRNQQKLRLLFLFFFRLILLNLIECV